MEQREIKFRGRRIDNGEWVYGSLLQSEIDVNQLAVETFICERFANEAQLNKIPVDPKTVGQLTGLLDKNNTPIFEGDILKGFQKEQSDKEGKNGYWIEDTVCWVGGGFKVFSKPLQNCYTRENNILYQFMWHDPGSFVNREGWYYELGEIEVIGNIFQNPKSRINPSINLRGGLKENKGYE